MFFEDKISMCDLNFLKKNMVNASYSETLQDNTFIYNDTTNIIEHKKVDITKGQFFTIPLEKLQVGDIIVLELDYMRVSGVDINIVYRQGNVIKENFKLSNNNEFNTYSYSFVVTQNIIEISTQNRIEIGYATPEVGDYKLKDVSINLKRRKDFKNNTPNNSVLGGMFYKTPSNSFTFHEGFINDFSFEIMENTIRIKFKNSSKRSIPTIQPLGLGSSLDYVYKIILIQNAYFDFQIFNKADNTQTVLSTLTNKELWLAISLITY